MSYAKRYGGGFVDKPTLTTPIDATFLNAVESALLALFDSNPGSAGMVPVWTPAGTHYVPQLLTNANIDPAAAIAKSKLAALSIVDADVAGGAAIAQSKIAGLSTALASIPSATGWSVIPATLTYSSTDGPTFVVTTGGIDLTGVVPVGSRIQLTHAATTKYFIVTAISATTITLYGGANYTLAATAITAPSFSIFKAPLGFPLDPISWTETLKDTTNRSIATPVQNSWNNVGGLSLSIPIGAWDVYYEASVQISTSAEASNDVYCTLSTANNTESDLDFTAWGFFSTTATSTGLIHTFFRRKSLLLAAKASYFLNLKWSNGSNAATMNFRGDQTSTIIRAVCAYL